MNVGELMRRLDFLIKDGFVKKDDEIWIVGHKNYPIKLTDLLFPTIKIIRLNRDKYEKESEGNGFMAFEREIKNEKTK